MNEQELRERKVAMFRGNLLDAALVTTQVLQYAQGIWASRDGNKIRQDLELLVDSFRATGDEYDVAQTGKIALTRNHSGNGYDVWVLAAEIFSFVPEDQKPRYTSLDPDKLVDQVADEAYPEAEEAMKVLIRRDVRKTLEALDRLGWSLRMGVPPREDEECGPDCYDREPQEEQNGGTH